MGQSLGASIIYGFKIHGEDEGWPLPYDDEEYEYIWPGWAKVEDGEAEEFEGQCQSQLIRVFADFTDPEPKFETKADESAWSAWYDKQREAKKRANIDCGEGSLDFHRAGISDYMDVYLGFEVYDFTWSDPRIDPGSIQEHLYQGVNHKGWGRTLERAVEVLNLVPREGFDLKPATHLLVTYW